MTAVQWTKQSLVDIVTVPRLSSGVFKIWLRNYFYFKNTMLATAFWAIFEPVLYLLAIGVGLGAFIGQIEDVSYTEWFVPGLLASTTMLVSFIQTTYGCFSKLNHQQIYASILHTPISSHDIALGEILWGASKGMMGACGVGLVGFMLGEISLSGILPALAILFLLSFAFASIGLLITSFATHYDSFIYAQSGFIMPMYLFSGTYFPVSQLPRWAQIAAWALPLTHGVSAVRVLLLGGISWMVPISAVVLLLMGLGAANWATARIHRQLIF